MLEKQQASIAAAFVQLLGEPGTLLRAFLNSMSLPQADSGKPKDEQPWVVLRGIPEGALLCVRFGNNQRYQRFGVERGGLRNAHEEFKKVAGYPRALPWLLRMDRSTTLEDIKEMIPVHVLFAMGACRVEFSLVLPRMTPQSSILPRHVMSLGAIRLQQLRHHAGSAQEAAYKQELADLKRANAGLLQQRRLQKELAKEQRAAHKLLSKAEKTEKRKQAQAEPGARPPLAPALAPSLTRDEIQAQADSKGHAVYNAYMAQHSLAGVLVIQQGGRSPPSPTPAPAPSDLLASTCRVCPVRALTQ
jgi:hypothetical protein